MKKHPQARNFLGLVLILVMSYQGPLLSLSPSYAEEKDFQSFYTDLQTSLESLASSPQEEEEETPKTFWERNKKLIIGVGAVALLSGIALGTWVYFSYTPHFSDDKDQQKICEVLKEIFKDNPDSINEEIKEGKTHLHKAAKQGLPDVCRFLLDSGARVDLKDDSSQYPFQYALGKTLKGNLDARKALGLILEATPHKKKDLISTTKTPLNYTLEKALKIGTSPMIIGEIFSLFLTKGFNAELTQIRERSLLTKLFDYQLNQGTPTQEEKRAYKRIVDEILGSAPQGYINSRDKYLGYAPLHLAVRYEFKYMVKHLLKKSPFIDIQTIEEKNTPLHLAVSQNSKSLVRLLLKKGALRTLQNNKGDTPLDYARDNNYKDIEEILETYNLPENFL